MSELDAIKASTSSDVKTAKAEAAVRKITASERKSTLNFPRKINSSFQKIR